ncbi:MAG: flagellar hook-length control protein FliK [Myxococcota bacterium]
MNVRVVGSAETRPSDPAAGRAGGGSGDFPSLMDSVLGDASAERSSAKTSDRTPARTSERAAARDERGVRNGETRADRRDAARASNAEDGRDQDDRADRPIEGAGAREAKAAPAPRRAPSRRSADEDALETDGSHAVANPPETAVVDPSTAAIPDWIALVRGDEAESGGVPAEVEGEGDAIGRGPVVPTLAAAGAGPAGEMPSGSVASGEATDEAVVGQAEVGPALEGVEVPARPASTGPRAAAAAEERAGRPGTVEAVASTPTDEATALVAEAPRAEGNARAADARPASLDATEATGDARRDPTRASAASPRSFEGPSASNAENGSTRAAADDDRIAAATASDPTPSDPTALRGPDAAPPARSDALVFAPTLRAPDVPPPTSEAGRPLPAAAPDAIAIQTDWLATRGGGTARLVLHPPELGEIAIRVTVRHQAVDVVMVAHTALAQQAAEDQSERLSQAFASRDLRLEQFEVRRSDPSDASSTGQFGSSDAGARERERAQDSDLGRGPGASRGGLRRGGAVGDGVAPPPRIVSSGRASGIDLRI